MKTLKVIIISGLVFAIAGATLMGIYGPDKTIVETVETYVSNVPQDIESIIKNNPDIAEAVRDEAEKRQIREEIIRLEAEVDKRVQRLVELENKGFTAVSTIEQN